MGTASLSKNGGNALESESFQDTRMTTSKAVRPVSRSRSVC